MSKNDIRYFDKAKLVEYITHNDQHLARPENHVFASDQIREGKRSDCSRKQNPCSCEGMSFDEYRKQLGI